MISYTRAISSAVEWGDLFKAAFDVFLPDLARKLQFDQPAFQEETRSLWHSFSQAIIFRAPGVLAVRSATKSPTSFSVDSTRSGRTAISAQTTQIGIEESTKESLAHADETRASH